MNAEASLFARGAAAIVVAPGGYTRERLARNEKFEIVRCTWREGQKSEFHTHGRSECWVSIESGRFGNDARWAGIEQSAAYTTGSVINTPVGAEHRLRCLSSEGTTLHVYSPPLTLAERVQGDVLGQLALGQVGLAWNEVEKLISGLREQAVPTHSPRFMNQLFSGLHPEALLADRVASETRTTLATLESSGIFSRVEAETVDALGGSIGWEKNARAGVAVPGGSAANFMALHLARHRAYPQLKTEGMAGSPKFAVFVSDQAHYSIRKGCAALGLGSAAVFAVESDAATGRMTPAALKRAITQAREQGRTPLTIVATAGTTVFGAFDPIRALGEIARAEGCWLHVDAAWGGPALFSARLRAQLDGIEFADSVTFDAHKLLGASLTCAFFLTPHAELLLQANDVSGADYLFHGELDRGRLSWQCGRGPDALALWLLWKSRGTQGFAKQVDALLAVRDEVLPWISQQPRLEWVQAPSYLNLCLRITPPGAEARPGSATASPLAKDWAIRVRNRLKDEHRIWVNFSLDDQGSAFLRLILVHPSLTADDVKTLLTQALAVTD